MGDVNKTGNGGDDGDIDLQQCHRSQQCSKDVDCVGDVNKAGSSILKSRPRLQVGRVHVHQQHPQNHLQSLVLGQVLAIISTYFISITFDRTRLF